MRQSTWMLEIGCHLLRPRGPRVFQSKPKPAVAKQGLWATGSKASAFLHLLAKPEKVRRQGLAHVVRSQAMDRNAISGKGHLGRPVLNFWKRDSRSDQGLLPKDPANGRRLARLRPKKLHGAPMACPKTESCHCGIHFRKFDRMT